LEKVIVSVKNEAQRTGKDLIDNVIDPEIYSFELEFRKLSGSSLTGMEREVLRAYLYSKILSEKGE
jgi:hypothetical protein